MNAAPNYPYQLKLFYGGTHDPLHPRMAVAFSISAMRLLISAQEVHLIHLFELNILVL